tara:strand:- start:40892 stop:41113 length:222 start_codon:yes stop_codon:yes gene_type:complete
MAKYRLWSAKENFYAWFSSEGIMFSRQLPESPYKCLPMEAIGRVMDTVARTNKNYEWVFVPYEQTTTDTTEEG